MCLYVCVCTRACTYVCAYVYMNTYNDQPAAATRPIERERAWRIWRERVWRISIWRSRDLEREGLSPLPAPALTHPY